MDRPGQHLLPGPALAGEEHRRPGGGDLAGVVDRRQEPGRLADDGVEPEALVERGPQRRHLPLERPGFRLGGAQPLLVLGQPLVLDLERERHGDHARDFGVGFVVPVRTRRHEEQDAAHALAEEDRYVERRPVAVLDHQPVAGACRIELTRSVPDEDDLAAGDPLQFRELLEGPRFRIHAAVPADEADALEALFGAGPQGEPHHLEIDEGPHRLAEPLEHIAELETGAQNRWQRGRCLQALAKAALTVQLDQGLDEGRDEVGEPPARRYVGVGVDAWGAAHDDEGAPHPSAGRERHGEPRPQPRLDDIRSQRGSLGEPSVGHHVGDDLRVSREDRSERHDLGRDSIAALECHGVVSAVAERRAPHGVLREERACAAVGFTALDREVIMGDQALGAGRELGEKAGRVERLGERPREGRHAVQEVRDVGRVVDALDAGHVLPVLGALLETRRRAVVSSGAVGRMRRDILRQPSSPVTAPTTHRATLHASCRA